MNLETILSEIESRAKNVLSFEDDEQAEDVLRLILALRKAIRTAERATVFSVQQTALDYIESEKVLISRILAGEKGPA